MYKIIRIAALIILFSSVLHAESVMTYSNPVLVETYEIHRPNPAHYKGTLGIGDPAVIYYNEKYYLYPTGDNFSYSVYISEDLIHWTKGPKVFESKETGVWAPDVFFNKHDNKFYLYYTVNKKIGVAISDRPDGLFKKQHDLVSNAIDAHLFRDDDGSYFLYYARYPDFAIFVQPMESPLKKKNSPVMLVSPTEQWEKTNVAVIEAPWMIKHNGSYYLLYSGGSADSEHYAIGYAKASHPLGPFTKYPGNPIVHKGGNIFGPGHVSITQDQEGKLWMIYHQQKDKTKGWNRIICIDPIWFDKDGVLHGKATRSTAQPAPLTKNRNVIKIYSP